MIKIIISILLAAQMANAEEKPQEKNWNLVGQAGNLNIGAMDTFGF